jgi:hypothetical protein
MRDVPELCVASEATKQLSARSATADLSARRVHDHGMPVSQGELLRDMME